MSYSRLSIMLNLFMLCAILSGCPEEVWDECEIMLQTYGTRFRHFQEEKRAIRALSSVEMNFILITRLRTE